MQTKAFWKSKTLWGLVFLLAPVVSEQIGVASPSDEALQQFQYQVVNAAEAISVLIGAALNIWGRLTATAKIGVKSK